MKKTNKKAYVFGSKFQNEKIYKTFLAAKYENVPTVQFRIQAGDEDLYNAPRKSYVIEAGEIEKIAYDMMVKNDHFQAGAMAFIDVLADEQPQLCKDVHAFLEQYPLPVSDALWSMFVAERFLHATFKEQRSDIGQIINKGVEKLNEVRTGLKNDYENTINKYKAN